MGSSWRLAEFLWAQGAAPSAFAAELLMVIFLLIIRVAQDVALGSSRAHARWFTRVADVGMLPILLLFLVFALGRVIGG